MLTLPKEIHGHFHPSVVISPVDGRTYIVPNWIEVPIGTTFDEVQKLWKPTKTTLPGFTNTKETFQVKSTDGLRTYEVSVHNQYWSCTCARFGFRSSCKHINKIRFNKK